jgi:hypothetical protein
MPTLRLISKVTRTKACALGLAMGSAWLSGINFYATIFTVWTATASHAPPSQIAKATRDPTAQVRTLAAPSPSARQIVKRRLQTVWWRSEQWRCDPTKSANRVFVYTLVSNSPTTLVILWGLIYIGFPSTPVFCTITLDYQLEVFTFFGWWVDQPRPNYPEDDVRPARAKLKRFCKLRRVNLTELEERGW